MLLTHCIYRNSEKEIDCDTEENFLKNRAEKLQGKSGYVINVPGWCFFPKNSQTYSVTIIQDMNNLHATGSR
jgi:hypothetical protein